MCSRSPGEQVLPPRMRKQRREQPPEIDWDALRAPTPPGRIPTPPWRHSKPKPTSSPPSLSSKEKVDTSTKDRDAVDNQTRAALSLPTPPMQAYDIPRWGTRKINWEQSTPDPRFGLDQVRYEIREPQALSNEVSRKMKISNLLNAA